MTGPANVLVVSDLHLGDPRSGRFEPKLLSLLIDDSHDLVVLNGDIIDLWVEMGMEKIISKHRPLVEILRRLTREKRLIWVLGNHEHTEHPSLSWFLLNQVVPGAVMKDEYVVTIQEVRCLITHGHQIEDAQLATRPGILFWLGLWIWKLTCLDLQKFCRTFLGLYRKKMTQLQEQFVGLRVRGFTHVVLGHTHAPIVGNVGAVKYVDAGDWVEHHTYAIISGNGVELRGES